MTMTMTPTRTREERLEALAYANEIRLARAKLKKQIKASPCIARYIVKWPSVYEHAAGMRVYDVLHSLHGVSPRIAERVLRRVGIGHTKTIENLTPRQRDALNAELAVRLPRERTKGP